MSMLTIHAAVYHVPSESVKALGEKESVWEKEFGEEMACLKGSVNISINTHALCWRKQHRNHVAQH